MTFNELYIKIKKRICYRILGLASIETYYMIVKTISLKEINFEYQGHPFFVRLNKSSDYDVTTQILVEQEYKVPASIVKFNNSNNKIIIDAGANIGLTTIYLKNIFENSTIICIEPDESNFLRLEKNVQNYVEDGSVKLYKAGLLGVSGLNLEISNDFGDQRDWAKAIKIKDNESNLKSISIIDLMRNEKIDTIDLLKIDIEGSETFLLDADTDLSFLSKTYCLAIEIHDHLDLRGNIYSLLEKYGFIYFEDQQTTIAINRSLKK